MQLLVRNMFHAYTFYWLGVKKKQNKSEHIVMYFKRKHTVTIRYVFVFAGHVPLLYQTTLVHEIICRRNDACLYETIRCMPIDI